MIAISYNLEKISVLLAHLTMKVITKTHHYLAVAFLRAL